MAERVSALEIISEILRNMGESCEELYSHTVVPSFYQVFLHPADFERLEPIVSRVVADAKNALDDEVARLNRGRLVDRLIAGKTRRHEPADREWRIELFRDPDQAQQPGTVAVRSQLLLPPRSGIREGAVTRFSVTRSDDVRDVAPPSEPSVPPPPDAVRAEFKYWSEGVPRTVTMRKLEFLIGRGGPENRVDLEIANPSVSEVHARVHQVQSTGVFFLENRGKFGTTVDGVAVARGTEVRLGRTARIAMAKDMAVVEFSAVGPT